MVFDVAIHAFTNGAPNLGLLDKKPFIATSIQRDFGKTTSVTPPTVNTEPETSPNQFRIILAQAHPTYHGLPIHTEPNSTSKCPTHQRGIQNALRNIYNSRHNLPSTLVGFGIRFDNNTHVCHVRPLTETDHPQKTTIPTTQSSTSYQGLPVHTESNAAIKCPTHQRGIQNALRNIYNGRHNLPSKLEGYEIRFNEDTHVCHVKPLVERVIKRTAHPQTTTIPTTTQPSNRRVIDANCRTKVEFNTPVEGETTTTHICTPIKKSS